MHARRVIMPEEEDNPFLIKKTETRPTEPRGEEFGTSELVSFMVEPAEVKRTEERFEDTFVSEKPHWEDAGKPVWDRGVNTFGITKDEVVDHDPKAKKTVE